MVRYTIGFKFSLIGKFQATGIYFLHTVIKKRHIEFVDYDHISETIESIKSKFRVYNPHLVNITIELFILMKLIGINIKSSKKIQLEELKVDSDTLNKQEQIRIERANERIRKAKAKSTKK